MTLFNRFYLIIKAETISKIITIVNQIKKKFIKMKCTYIHIDSYIIKNIIK